MDIFTSASVSVVIHADPVNWEPKPVWGHHYPKSAAVIPLISSDIHCRLMQEATIWSTMYVRSVRTSSAISMISAWCASQLLVWGMVMVCPTTKLDIRFAPLGFITELCPAHLVLVFLFLTCGGKFLTFQRFSKSIGRVFLVWYLLFSFSYRTLSR
jgi:hypothetical protein